MKGFTLFTWNVNYSQRTINEFECFDWAHRKTDVFFNLLQVMTIDTIFCIQEVSDGSKKDILEFFHKQDFKCFIQQTHPAGRYIVTAVHNTHTSERDNRLKQLSDIRLSCMAINVNDKLVVVNVHFSVGKDFRFAQSNQVATYVTGLELPWIVAGDMNTFPDRCGHEQILKFQRIAGGADVTSLMLRDSDASARALKTFSPYPYDKIPKVLPYNLDHILVKGSTLKCETPTCGDDSFTINFKGEKYSTSDHFFLKMKFDLE